ncbi:alpha/beta hydrolase [Arthrobacter sp. MYb23]|uniref:alpha/beta hydrolase n=1 Tax=unclassified Arthrobacter TaxID=235627 RepID=UPI000CFC38E7|nr:MULTISPECIES: alpha/beta hydrolase [unclassified Arthrobacter]PRB43887.1 alpha/beta hydrolase [Arthrobacter sp. MYb51]PRB97492.1 alpha/beta hydrolase [Arthrobacter sp. MYb23]
MTSSPNALPVTRRPVLFWASAACVAALTLAPLWMLLGNPAVLRGHPLLPSLLVTSAVVGVLWGVLLWRRRAMSPKRSVARAVGAWAARVAVLALVAMMVWLNPFAYQASGAAEAGSAAGVSLVDSPTALTLTPAGASASKGLIFYPGARVEARAYADILKPAADAGVLVVILKTPLNLSLLDGNQARGAMADHPEISTWTVGGHSLGGVSASSFALGNQDVDGLLLYASYPLDSLRDRSGLRVLSVSGSEDGLSTPAKVDASRDLLPLDASFVEVQGGNHAFFGNYGAQPGDGEPSVDREVAQQQISGATVAFLTELKG